MSGGSVPPTIAQVFDAEWTRLVAILVRDLRDVGTAEDAAQDAFIEASARWPLDGLPRRPGAWLLTTARRKAIDRLRRAKRMEALLPLVSAGSADACAADEPDDAARAFDDALDDQLALVVGCCHPALAPDAQLALTLRIVGGLSTAQIARAFLVSEATMTRRLSRAKEKIRVAAIPFDPPDLATLAARLPVVCGVIHSIFTQGHTNAHATELVRGDLCDEAIWLGELVDRLVPDDADVAGLLALMLLVDARRATRVDGDGFPVLLSDQDRTRWDRQRIGRGLAALTRARGAAGSSPYPFHAAIAALHATAPTFASTDWRGIVALYDALLVRQPTVLVALNRAIALAEADGAGPGLDAIDAIADQAQLGGDLHEYPYFHSARGELLARLGRGQDALDALDRSLAVSSNEAERRFLLRRREEIAASTS